MGKRIDYPFEIRPLSPEEGGGFLISYPDFSECLTLHDRVHQGAQRRELMLGAQRQQRQSGVRVALEGRRKADFAGAFIELEVRQ